MSGNAKDTRAVDNRKKKHELKRKTSAVKHNDNNVSTNKHQAKNNSQPSGNQKNATSQKKQSTKKVHGKYVEPQPLISGAELEIDDTKEENYMIKDFQTLINAPLSEGGHFVFKTEQEWMVNTEELSEFFSPDLRKLSAAIECIPYHELHNIEEEYFTKDQIMLLQNKAAKAREIYEVETANDTSPQETNIMESKNLRDRQESVDDEKQADIGIEDDLEFLLSLKEPVERTEPSLTILHSASKSFTGTKMGLKEGNSSKSIDLEDWLDSVLDD